MSEDGIYPELQGFLIRDREAPPPKIPLNCPICGSMATYHVVSGETTTCAVYGCDGHYTPKPQIQNHTRIWWGHCGKSNHEAVLALAAFWVRSLVDEHNSTAIRVMERYYSAESERPVNEVALQILSEADY